MPKVVNDDFSEPSVKHNPAAETVRVGWVVTLDAAVGVGDGEVIYGHIISVGDLIPIPSMMTVWISADSDKCRFSLYLTQ